MQVRKWWLFTHLDEKHDRTETLPQVMVKYWSEKSHTFVCSQSIPCQRLPFMTDCRYILSSFKRLPLHLHYFITMPMLYNCFQILVCTRPIISSVMLHGGVNFAKAHLQLLKFLFLFSFLCMWLLNMSFHNSSLLKVHYTDTREGNTSYIMDRLHNNSGRVKYVPKSKAIVDYI